MAATATVTITIVGVRKEHLARLKTVVKGQLGRFGSYTIDDGGEVEPKKEPPHKRKR